MKKILSIIFLLMSFSTTVSAYDFMVDGLCYDINDDGESVKVTFEKFLEDLNYKDISGEIVIPERVEHSGKSYIVTSIGWSAFEGCTGLTSVNIPNSVTEIGWSAFEGCTGLTSVGIPNSVTEIGHYAFSGCTGLTSVEIPDSLTEIRNSTFKGCIGLTSVKIPSLVTMIGDSAFEGCTGLTSVTIGNLVTLIGYAAFRYCTGLTSVKIPNSVTQIGSSAFEGCTGLTSMKIPNSVTKIGNSAFEGCSGLKSVSIGNSVTEIGYSAFSGCTGLTTIKIPNSITSIGSNIFDGTDVFGGTAWYDNQPDGLIYIGKVVYKYKGEMPDGTSIVLKDGCTGIYDSAFSGCTGLTSVKVPNSVTEIGQSAFFGCTGLTSLEIPNSVTEIGRSAFSGCTGLTSLRISNSVTEIGWSAFSDCTGLTSLEIPKSVTEIGWYAFSGCTGLTSLEIPNSVTEIGGYAFSGCSGLTSVSIGSSVTDIGFSPFYGCNGLLSITVDKRNNRYDSRENCNAIIETATNILIAGCMNTVIPNSVTEIGRSAFEGCTGLTSVKIPNSVTKIGYSSFKGCTELTSMTILNVEEQNNSNPTLSTIIGSEAFSGCYSLVTIDLGNSVISIDDRAFKGCLSLKSVRIPNSVTKIGDEAFEDCISLASIIIPNSVMDIGCEAFASCTGLTSIVSEIKKPQLVVYGTESWRKDAATTIFSGVDLANCILNIPKGSRISYEKTSPWLSFANKIESVDSTPDNNQIITVDEIKLNLQQDYEKRCYNSVIQLGEQLFQTPDFTSNPDNADLIIQIAESYYFMQLYMKAKECYGIALKIYESKNKENSIDVARMQEKIGKCYYKMREYDKAKDCFEVASPIYLYNNQECKYAFAQEMIGHCCLFSTVDGFDQAKDHYLKAIKGYENFHYLRGFICHIALEQFNEAKECYLAADMDYRWLDNYLLQMTECLQNRFDYYYSHKRYDDAINLCTQAIDFDQIPQYIYEIVDLYEKIGRCYYAKNNPDSALINYQQAQDLIENTGFNPGIQSQLNEDIALCYISKGDYATAYTYIKESVEMRQENTLNYFGVNTTAERAEYWESQSHLFQNTYPAVALEVYNHEDTTQGQREMLCDLYDKSALFSKGLLLTSENEFKRIILDSENPQLIAKYYELQEINIKLNELKIQKSIIDNEEIAQLEQYAKTIEGELLAFSQGYRDFRENLKISWDSVQAKLGTDSIAIEFLSFPNLRNDGTMYVALTLRPGYTHPHMTVLCEESELIEAAKQPYTSTALSDIIWGKLYRAGELNDVKNIFFSPCGELHKIGIESMPHWSKPGVMMTDSVEGFNIYRLSSTRELALNRTPIESTGAAVFGGIYYKGDTTKLGARYKGHEGLYATRGFDFGDVDLRGISSTDFLSASLDEVKSIKALFENRKDSVYYKTEFDATEASFKALEGQKKRIIHIATHGFFLTDSAARAEKQKGNVQFLTDDAMTHSGLLFAAAANTVKDHKKISDSWEDGVLTAYEVSQLNLRGLDLVVLSACQTGNGEISGEGVFGMQRGFKMAGAQSIIMSLWDVDDEATKDMMTKFYSYWLEGDGMSKREAFLKAQQDVRNKDQDNKYSYSYVDKDNNKESCSSTSQEYEKRRKYEELRNTRPHWAAFILLDAME